MATRVVSSARKIIGCVASTFSGNAHSPHAMVMPVGMTSSDTTSITSGVPTPMTHALASLNRPILVDRVVYATITLMSVLIIYDGWQQLRLIDVVAVIAGPVLAMFIAHLFSGSLATQVELGRGLTGNELIPIVRSEALSAPVRPTAGDRQSSVCLRRVAHRCDSSDPVDRGRVVGLLGICRRSLRGDRRVASAGAHRGRPGRRDRRPAAPGRAPAGEGILRRPRTGMSSTLFDARLSARRRRMANPGVAG